MNSIQKKVDQIINSANITPDEQRLLDQQLAHDDTTARHAADVAQIAVTFAVWEKEKGVRDWSDQDLFALYHAGMLHDIGKLMIPEEIIEKPGKLTPAERNIVKHHAEYAERFISENIPFASDVLDCALGHHSAYTELSDLAQIIAVADVYSALTMERSYKDPIPADKVTDIMINMKDLHNGLVKELFDMIKEYPELNHAKEITASLSDNPLEHAEKLRERDQKVLSYLKSKYKDLVGDLVIQAGPFYDSDGRVWELGAVDLSIEKAIATIDTKTRFITDEPEECSLMGGDEIEKWHDIFGIDMDWETEEIRHRDDITL
jgi:HD superfamily phosphohydrolase YqeK